jgi:hypothetical protein
MENENFKRLFDYLAKGFEVASILDKLINFDEYEIIAQHEKLPAWWAENNNFVLCPLKRTKTTIPNIVLHGGHENCSNFILFCNEHSDCNVVVWGDGGLIYYSPHSRIIGSRAIITLT